MNGAPSELINKLNFLRKIAIYLSNHDVNESIDTIIQLIDRDTGYSDYRIVNDCESDDRNLWIEYDNGHDNITLSAGDILIKMK